jgi:hypothetical protein
MQPKYSSLSNQAQRESSTYRLAETDRDFLLGNSMRGASSATLWENGCDRLVLMRAGLFALN